MPEENVTQEAAPKPMKLTVSAAPHLGSVESVSTVMWTVTATLLPAAAVGVFYFGLPALWVMLTCIAAAMATEYVGERLVLGKKTVPLHDGSAFLTGLLLAFCLPPGIAPWKAAVGAAVAIFVAKTVFGGLGFNIFNPALIGRAVLLAAWPGAMTAWTLPRNGALVPSALFGPGVDAVTQATPLAAVKGAIAAAARSGKQIDLGSIQPTIADLQSLFLGNVGGCIGETCALALLIGGLWLMWRKIISWHIPVVYIGTVFVLSIAVSAPRAFAGGGDPAVFLLSMGLFHVLSGGLLLGAFFMATDMVTSPMTNIGKIIFAAGAGILVVLIRTAGGYPEGVCYSILLMNMTVPLIDRFTMPKKFGLKKAA